MTKSKSGPWPVNRDGSVRSHFGGRNYEPSTIVTKAEVERLEAMRAKPAPRPTPKPKAFDHARQDSGLDRLNERRLHHQRTRLKVAGFQLNRDRLKAMNKDKAKTNFKKTARSPLSKQKVRRADQERER